MIIEAVDRSRYFHFIDNMPDALVHFESVVDESKNTTDYVFLDANKSFEQLIGVKVEKVLGKRLSEVSLDGIIEGFDFIDICGKVSSLEENIKFECYSTILKKWYLIYYYKGEKNCFCVVFHDISEIKNRAEKIDSLYELAAKFHETTFLEIDYQEYRTVFNGSQDAMFLINVNSDSSFAYYMVNKGYEIDVGTSAETVNGMTPRGLYGEVIGKQIEEHYIDCIAAKKPIIYEEEFILLGEKKVWHTLLSPIMNEGRVVQIVGSSRNITKLKAWEDEVARERQLFKVTLHSIGDAVITTDTKNRIVILNKAAEKLTGWSQEEASGKLLNEVMTTVSEKKYSLLEYSSGQDPMDRKQHKEYKILISRDGNKRIISSSEAFIKDECASILGVVIVFRDVTEEKQKEEEVRYLGYHDKLTGLYNRAYFEEALMRLDNEAYMPLGIIMGDSNGLKMVNDVFGHEDGDKLLKSIGEIFKTICGNDDIVARVGGDEFAIILPRTSTEKTNAIISSIKQMCSIEIVDPISPSIALGASIKTDKSEDIKIVYKLAEDRMYNNKLVESKSIRSSIISSLKKTLEERTHETETHAQRLKELSMKMGKIMGIYDNERDDLSLLAMLHDIGKIAIPDYILGKPAKLTEDEWKIMKSHCEIGYRIAVASPELAHIANLILTHHERWDGTGYPQGLKGEEIPLLSRIIAVVDAYDAMTSDRPYHAAVQNGDALKELERCSATQFDPYIVEKFIEIMSNTN